MDGLPEMIIVNGSMFCKLHGDEYCSRCFCDHRMGNNHVHDLYEVLGELIEETGFDLEERLSRNALRQGAVPVRAGSEEYKCTAHNTQDCGRCFNWVGIVRHEVEEVRRDEWWLERRKKWLDRVDP